jgi:hypothetical protein
MCFAKYISKKFATNLVFSCLYLMFISLLSSLLITLVLFVCFVSVFAVTDTKENKSMLKWEIKINEQIQKKSVNFLFFE